MSGAGGPLVPATSLSNRPPKQPWHRTDHPGALGRSCQPLPLHNRAGRPVSVPYSQAAKASGGRPKPQLQQGHSAEGAAARQSPPPPPPPDSHPDTFPGTAHPLFREGRGRPPPRIL